MSPETTPRIPDQVEWGRGGNGAQSEACLDDPRYSGRYLESLCLAVYSGMILLESSDVVEGIQPGVKETQGF